MKPKVMQVNWQKLSLRFKVDTLSRQRIDLAAQLQWDKDRQWDRGRGSGRGLKRFRFRNQSTKVIKSLSESYKKFCLVCQKSQQSSHMFRIPNGDPLPAPHSSRCPRTNPSNAKPMQINKGRDAGGGVDCLARARGGEWCELETSLYRKLCATKMRYEERIPKDFTDF